MTRAQMRARASLVAIVGAGLIVLAYWGSGSEWRSATATSERLNQDWRCIIANGRSLRGATTADCANYWGRVRHDRTP